MAIQRLYSWESGATMIPSGDIIAGVPVATTAQKHTGSYSLYLSEDAVRFPYAAIETNPAISFWVYLNDGYTGTSGVTFYVRFIMDDASYIELRWNVVKHTFDLYVNGSLAESGAFYITNNSWFNVSIYLIVSDTGLVQVALNGNIAINYVGDTKPNAGTTGVEYVHLDALIGTNSKPYIDDLAIGSDQLLPALICEDLRPNGDSAVQWTPSTGVTNYNLTDETPPSDVDYVSTPTTAQVDKYTMADWDNTNNTPVAVTAWARAKMESGTGDALKVGFDSNGTDDVTQSALSADYEYYFHTNDQNPDTATDWDDTAIDALLLEIESVIS